ncbi:MAG TPA: ERF family protein [Rhodanobacter sp.]|nr:ERF family protein [Rhodanobacter sp.]
MSNAARVIEHEPKTLQVSAPSNSPMGSALAFLQGGGNIEQLNHMMDLQDRWEANEARKAFTVAMTGFKAEPVEIFKRKEVAFLDVKYMHAELSDITDAIGPALAKHSLSFRWNVHQESGAIKVDCILTHVLGHSETVTMTGSPDKSGKKNDIQSIASTTTYLQRYTLLAITGMSTKGMDNDGRGSEEPGAPEDDKALDWIATAEGLISLDDYKAKKAEVIKVYGDVKNVPKPVLAAFNAKFNKLKASAK